MHGRWLTKVQKPVRFIRISQSFRRFLGTQQSFSQQQKIHSNMLLSVDTLLNGAGLAILINHVLVVQKAEVLCDHADLRVNIMPQWNDDCLVHHSRCVQFYGVFRAFFHSNRAIVSTIHPLTSSSRGVVNVDQHLRQRNTTKADGLLL